jgi:hypothetical protein
MFSGEQCHPHQDFLWLVQQYYHLLCQWWNCWTVHVFLFCPFLCPLSLSLGSPQLSLEWNHS